MEITVDKNELLTVLIRNRDNHREVFEEAVNGWRETVLAALETETARIMSGKLPKSVNITLPAPEDHTRDYNRVIGMLKMHQETEFTLSEQEYSMYVDDNWDWKRRWALSNSAYAGGKFAEVYGADYLGE